MLTVLVRGLEFYGYHGVPAEERIIGHRFRADLELEVETKAHLDDAVAGTADYASIAATTLRIAQSSQAQTVERLAMEVAEALLAECPMASTVEIALVKLLPPMPVIAQEAGVRLRHSRR